jgi:hypothetical protein
MMRAGSAVGIAAATLLVVTACGNTSASGRGESDVGEPSPATKAPVEAPPHDDVGARFTPALFGEDSATVDNPWAQLTPGTQLTYEGQALDGDETVKRRIIVTVSDMTKDIGGVQALVVWERDIDDDVLMEGELAFEAQDKDGNLWHLGEYRETFDEEELIGGRLWVVNDPEGAQAGILMPADPQPGGPSFSEGFAPPPWNWDDRGRVRGTEDETCVEAGCFKDVVIIEEFEPSVPDAFQLKYYARDVGLVKIGWDGANEAEQEELELVDQVELSPDELAEVRAEVLAIDDRGLSYGRLGPVQPITAGP